MSKYFHINFGILVKLILITFFSYQIVEEIVNYLNYDVIYDLQYDPKSAYFVYNSSITLCFNRHYSREFRNQSNYAFWASIEFWCTSRGGVDSTIDCADLVYTYGTGGTGVFV